MVYVGYPEFWTDLTDRVRQAILDRLRDGAQLEAMPSHWRRGSYKDRCDVIRKLSEDGLLNDAQYRALFRADRPKPLYEVGRKQRDRILPIEYRAMTTMWLRGNGKTIPPKDMDTTHLENSMRLLNESHGNFVARACVALGSIFERTDDLGCIELAVRLMELDVEDLYPVFGALQAEWLDRPDRGMYPGEPGIMVGRDLRDPPPTDLDEALSRAGW